MPPGVTLDEIGALGDVLGRKLDHHDCRIVRLILTRFNARNQVSSTALNNQRDASEREFQIEHLVRTFHVQAGRVQRKLDLGFTSESRNGGLRPEWSASFNALHHETKHRRSTVQAREVGTRNGETQLLSLESPLKRLSPLSRP
jgi:hypothetical protein